MLHYRAYYSALRITTPRGTILVIIITNAVDRAHRRQVGNEKRCAWRVPLLGRAQAAMAGTAPAAPPLLAGLKATKGPASIIN